MLIASNYKQLLQVFVIELLRHCLRCVLQAKNNETPVQTEKVDIGRRWRWRQCKNLVCVLMLK